jgi:hypothetical protein
MARLFRPLFGGMQNHNRRNTTSQLCKEWNIPYEAIGASMEPIWQALTEAKRAALIVYESKMRTIQFKTIMTTLMMG